MDTADSGSGTPALSAVPPYLAQFKYAAKTKTKNIDFFVTEDYKVDKQIGSGSYGIVCKAVHRNSGEDVAIKQITMPPMCDPRPPHPLSDFEVVASRTLREIRIVQFLNKHIRARGVDLSHFIDVKDILQLRTKNVDTIYTVTQLMPSDLHAVLRNPRQLLGVEHVQFIMYNLLRAINYLHTANLAHRDIKPQNILVNDNCEVVLCDFGLAREISDDDMTVYVETRWYRAPELIMGLPTYNEKVDIWSLGCVLAEMLMPVGHRNPLWRGTNAKDQLDQVLCTLGVPTADSIKGIGTRSALSYIEKMRAMEYVPKASRLADRFPANTNPQAIDLLGKMLAFVPAERFSAAECLAHPFFTGFLDEGEVEPTCPEPYRDDEFEFVYDTSISSAERSKKLKEMLYDEMLKYHPELQGHDPDVELNDIHNLGSIVEE